MESNFKSGLHTFAVVMLCILFYNQVVRQFTPTGVQTLIGI